MTIEQEKVLELTCLLYAESIEGIKFSQIQCTPKFVSCLFNALSISAESKEISEEYFVEILESEESWDYLNKNCANLPFKGYILRDMHEMLEIVEEP